MDLRDYCTSLWSQPVRSKQLEKEFQAKSKIKAASPPRLHCAKDVAVAAQTQLEVQRLTQLCQKAGNQRTEDDIRSICNLVCSICPFFALWPPILQQEMAAMLATEVLVQHESVLSCGTVPTKMFIVLSGTLHVYGPGGAAHSLERSHHGLQSTSLSKACQHKSPKPSPAQTSQAGGIRSPTSLPNGVVAELKKGDTCGEAILLGSHASTADVVVGSKGAVLLSLPVSHFLRSFKELLGLRQQDRLEFLLGHPLCRGLTLGELDAVAQLLQTTFHAPGAVMSPHTSTEGQCMVLLAEGEVCLRRSHGNASTPGYQVGTSATADQPVRGHDSNVVCVLQAPAILSSRTADDGLIVVAVTQVKAFYLPFDSISSLSANVQQVLQSAESFLTSYQSSRGQACNHGTTTARIHSSRRLQVLQNNNATQKPFPDQKAAPIHDSNQQQAHTGEGMLPTTQQYVTADQQPSNTGADNSFGSSDDARHALLNALAAQQVLSVMDTTLRRDNKTGLLVKTADTRCSPAVSTSPARHMHVKQKHKIHQALTPVHTAARNRAEDIYGPPLGMLHPQQTTWPRVQCGRRVCVDSEVPKPQPVPSTVRQRHACIHQSAVLALSVRPSTRDGLLKDSDSEENLIAKGCQGQRQPSRNLSGHSRSRSQSLKSSTQRPTINTGAVTVHPPWFITAGDAGPTSDYAPGAADCALTCNQQAVVHAGDGGCNAAGQGRDNQVEQPLMYGNCIGVETPEPLKIMTSHGTPLALDMNSASPQQVDASTAEQDTELQNSRSPRLQTVFRAQPADQPGTTHGSCTAQTPSRACQEAVPIRLPGQLSKPRPSDVVPHQQFKLPPSVALGYESLNPVQWAAFTASSPTNELWGSWSMFGSPKRNNHADRAGSNPQLTPTSTDNLLPAPKWQ